VPILAARARDQYLNLAVIVGAALAGLLGVLLAPGVAVLWMMFLGLGQGGALGLGLMLPVLRGRGPAEVASLSAMSMGVGYVIAAAGPAIVGAMRDASGGWTWPIVVLMAITLAEAPAALYAAKGRPT
jgi:CP family cyanate transporter-like MFS transporter